MELSALQRQRFYATDATSVFETRVLQCVKGYCKTHEGLADVSERVEIEMLNKCGIAFCAH